MPDVFQAVRREGHAALSAIESLADVNVVDDSGETLLHAAIAHANFDAAYELIRRGIDVNAQNKKGLTPLHYAAVYQHGEIAESILQHGGDFQIVDEHENTPLWTATFHARGNYEVVQVLVANGASKVAYQKNKHNRSPVDFANTIGDNELQNILTANAKDNPEDTPPQ